MCFILSLTVCCMLSHWCLSSPAVFRCFSKLIRCLSRASAVCVVCFMQNFKFETAGF